MTDTIASAYREPHANAADLDDLKDRVELRGRYEMLLQELRVLLPGVQVLLAFLLTVPFAAGFRRLDSMGRALFAVAMMSALASVVLLLCPVMFHRVGQRTARRLRLIWGIRAVMTGIVLVAVSIVFGVWCVARFAFGGVATTWIPVAASALFIGLWCVVPRALVRSDSGEEDSSPAVAPGGRGPLTRTKEATPCLDDGHPVPR